MSLSDHSALEVQSDGTCPACGRWAEIRCSVHGHLEGDPWAEVERLEALLRDWLEEIGVRCFEEPCASDDGCEICSNEVCGKCLICRTRAALDEQLHDEGTTDE